MSATEEIAAAAARLVVEEGLEYGPAKRRALRDLGLAGGRRAELPDNDLLEDHVREYIDIFCADTQPAELQALRGVALGWMRSLQEFRPHLTGAVWRGTATRLSAVHIDLYCDDSKGAELALVNRGVDFEVQSTDRGGESFSVLSVASRSEPLGGEWVTVHLTVLDRDDVRGALKPDARGRTWRGDLPALERLMSEAAAGGAAQ